MITVHKVTGPAVFASYLVNGDESGLDYIDKSYADKWLKNIAPWFVVDVDRDNEGNAIEQRFTWSYDLHGGNSRGGDVIDYICHEHKND